jgi:DNA-binding winged helix-turn-helix (wHTH) protein/tetratricopeptide (TPR) repeat protein
MDVARQSRSGFLTTADLAARPEFSLGGMIITPSMRQLRGRAGEVVVEPRVMQVLVVLAESGGQVVTRETLFDRCWGNVYVGDDSLNRAIAALRRAIDGVGARIKIDTIPRTGYRLSSANEGSADNSSGEAPTARGLPRRWVIGGGAAIAAVVAIGGGMWRVSTRIDPRFQQLIDTAEDAIRQQTADEQTVRMLRQAIFIHPESARAWGLLALVRSFLMPDRPADVPRAVAEAEKTARKALSLDPTETNALLAMFELEGSTLDWITRDRRLRQILAIDPNNIVALAELTLLTAATGLVRESWDWNERSLALEPLNRISIGMRAMKLWVFGRMAEADKVIDQLRALYPDDPWVWFVRVQLYAFTGRVGAALGLLDSEPLTHGRSPLANLWRASLPAIDDPSPGNITKAREAAIRAVQGSVRAANEAILIMSTLGELDMAFEIADGTLLSRGSLVPRERPGTDHEASKNPTWRTGTQWMWAPPVAAMRADPRFLPLCAGVGLTDYWQKRGVKPDYMRAGR